MSARELAVLGTASQVPTRRRNHNGYLLRWNGAGILFDPGEGTQRQLTFAGIPASAITAICITHLHGDHCLGLPGVIQRLSRDDVRHPVHVFFPVSGAPYIDRLRQAAIFHSGVELVLHPVDGDGEVGVVAGCQLVARRLDHSADAVGWRLQEPDGVRMLQERLAAAGVRGPDVGRLQREGVLDVNGRRVSLAEVSEPRPGQVFAFVMDTRVCTGAEDLAAGADLLVIESTFLDRDERLAAEYGHLTARQAAGIAARGGARHLVLTHFSQRYADPAEYHAEAAALVDDVVVAEDLARVPVPPRR